MGATYEIRGTTGDVTTCSCCGRRGLRKTVVMVPVDADGARGDAEFYGTGCAAAAIGWTDNRVRKTAKAADARAASARRKTPAGAAAQAVFQVNGWRDRIGRRVAEGSANIDTAKATAYRTAEAVALYAPARRAEVEAQALAAYEAGGWAALLELVDAHLAEAQQLAA